ncbi:MAG: hypothetical protein HOV94_17780 [Saccharothrix sp.]|nr:hypothetical protein [Saccharothrix sp.]
MARGVVVAIALALLAVLAPSPPGLGPVARAPSGHSAAVGSEEESGRECRKVAQPRSWSTRSSPPRPAGNPHREAVGAKRRVADPHTGPPVGRGRAEHLRSWSSPPALQVFRR